MSEDHGSKKSKNNMPPNADGLKRRDLLLSGSALVAPSAMGNR
jgi:hypothetical protein